jgi:AAA ATPase domain
VSSGSIGVNPFTQQPAGKYFVGREQQLARFDRALDDLRAARPRHIYVAGGNGRGKTSYLDKLLEKARSAGVLAVRAALDGAALSEHRQIASVLESVVHEVDKALVRKVKVGRLVDEWHRPGGSPFRLAQADALQNEHLRQDLQRIGDAVAVEDLGPIVICIDEGERIRPYALSALRSALVNLDTFLLVLAVKVDDSANPVEAGRSVLEGIATGASGDAGAARMFAGEVGLGPFTPEQARECVKLRLVGNIRSFDGQVIDLISRVSEGYPDRVIDYAHGVYELMTDDQNNAATVDTFRRYFADRHRKTMDEAIALGGQLSPSERLTLLELALHSTPIAVRDLAKRRYPKAPRDTLDDIAAGLTGGALHAACEASFCDVREAGYLVPDGNRRYALEIVMGRL